jgi:predicted  nucleic acid-binding Zn-ribbon protein
MNIGRKFLTIGIASAVLMSCEQDNRQERADSFRDDYRDWQQDYREKSREVEDVRNPVMHWHETFDQETIPEERTIAGQTEVPAITDTVALKQLVPRIAELDQKHDAIQDEHRALMEKHDSFITRGDLVTMDDEEWDNQRDLIRSDQDRMDNDLDELKSQWEEIRDQVENISAPSERTGARTTPAPSVDPRTTSPPREN